MAACILIINNEKKLGNKLQDTLTAEGYRVIRAYSASEGQLILERQRPGLVLLYMLTPEISAGETVSRFRTAPVLVIAGKGADRTAMGLEEQADGGRVALLQRPFGAREFLSAVRDMLERFPQEQEETAAYGGISLKLDEARVTLNGKPLRLTRMEYQVLRVLIFYPNQIISRRVLLEQVKKAAPRCSDSSLRTHVRHLRRKLRRGSGREYIETVWRMGYRLSVNESLLPLQ